MKFNWVLSGNKILKQVNYVYAILNTVYFIFSCESVREIDCVQPDTSAKEKIV